MKIIELSIIFISKLGKTHPKYSRSRQASRQPSHQKIGTLKTARLRFGSRFENWPSGQDAKKLP